MALPPPGTTDEKTGRAPAKELLKRIDIGLTTGILATAIAFFSLVIGWQQTRMGLAAQKASVLPIIDIDLGYEGVGDRSETRFIVRLNNVGEGLAHVQRVVPLQHGEPIETIQAFDDVIMNRRMRNNVGFPLTDKSTGFLRAGDSLTPRSYRMGMAGSELNAYLRGQFGTPLDGLDLEVCYCSVFDDCWTVRHADRKVPEPVASCGIDDVPVDYFQNYVDETAAARLEK